MILKNDADRSLIARAVVAALAGGLVLGCGSEPGPKPDTGAPPVSYKMVPATTGGGEVGASPAPSPTSAAPSTGLPAGNPPSAGSD